jgi:hypothetical protein
VPKSKIKIALVSGGPNVYFTPWGAAAEAEAKALGVTVSYVVPTHRDVYSVRPDEHDRIAGRQGLQRLRYLPGRRGVDRSAL